MEDDEVFPFSLRARGSRRSPAPSPISRMWFVNRWLMGNPPGRTPFHLELRFLLEPPLSCAEVFSRCQPLRAASR
jgi:hypothetical protein